MDEAEVRRRMYRAPTPQERERWHAPWLLAQGWTAAAVAQALERDAHTISNGPRRSRKAVRGRGLLSSQEAPPALNGEQQAELKAAVQELPSQAGIELSSWNWKAVRR